MSEQQEGSLCAGAERVLEERVVMMGQEILKGHVGPPRIW